MWPAKLSTKLKRSSKIRIRLNHLNLDWISDDKSVWQTRLRMSARRYDWRISMTIRHALFDDNSWAQFETIQADLAKRTTYPNQMMMAVVRNFNKPRNLFVRFQVAEPHISSTVILFYNLTERLWPSLKKYPGMFGLNGFYFILETNIRLNYQTKSSKRWRADNSIDD